MEYVGTVDILTDAMILTEQHMADALEEFKLQVADDVPNGTQGEPRLIKICHRLNLGKAEYTFAIAAVSPAKEAKAPAAKATPAKAEAESA